MNKRLSLFSVWVCCGIIAIAASGATAPPPLLPHRPVSFTQNFRLLLVRNIFDASRTIDKGTTVSISVPVAQPQSTLTLTGLVYEDGAYSAFVEDSRTNTTTKFKIGQSIAGGKIVGAGMDYVDLLTSGHTLHIYLGQTMAGTSPSATTNPTTLPSPGNDMIERLRQRRLQELHQ